MLVVGVFLRSVRATSIPAVATVVALLGTFGVMLLLGFSLNNLSLMALTVATGFVVDDAIVVLENTSRHIEAGMDRMAAALLGAREVGFTVLSISLSLVAVFIPLLFMDGQIGRLFREFAVTLVGRGADLAGDLADDDADDVRLAAASPAERRAQAAPGRAGALRRARLRTGVLRLLRGSLDWALASKGLVMLILLAVDRPQRLPVQRRAEGLLPAAGQRPAATAACAPTRASRRRRWARSCARWSTSSAAIRRSTPWSASPAAGAPAAASCSST